MSHELYKAAERADAKFQRELERVFGKSRAGDMRYQTEAFSDARLRRAFRDKRAADEKLRAEWELTRENPRPRATKRKPTPRKKPNPKTRAAPPPRAGNTRARRYRATVMRGRKTEQREFNAASDTAALRYANGLMLAKLPQGSRVTRLEHVGAAKKKVSARPNPAQPPDLKRALAAFRRFAGHSADFLEEHVLPVPGAAWALGPVTSIGYIATRDGETVEYVHEFRPRSAPLLAASSDGENLLLLGGAYRVTDRGIVDS